MDKYSYISNAHGTYLDEMYQAYKSDPSSVDESWQRFFEGYEFSLQKFGEDGIEDQGSLSSKEIAVRELIDAYRSRGHLLSKTNPVRDRLDRRALLEKEHFGLTDADLEVEFQAGEMIGIGRATLKKIIAALEKIYCGHIGFEYMSIRDPKMLQWFRDKVESEFLDFSLSLDEKKRTLLKLNEAVVFENFLHTKFIGQKRFSLEGGETTIPALDAAISKGAELGVEKVIIGMAHRGRLNVLTNIMGKTYEQVFSEFEGTALPDETLGDGDVKYHMGFSSQITSPSGSKVHLNLVPNPSHLEAVSPVVMGIARAEIDQNYSKNEYKVLPILIHGDAAIAGQGVVYETTQMSELQGYRVGGTIHFIINNQVGFTTDFHDARSSTYCTDVSSLTEAPEIHVNGDDPEAVVFAMKTAIEFRQRYKKDIFIDMVCYRRHGHNESDEPRFTQPKLYQQISKHPNPREIYNKHLLEGGHVDKELAKTMDKEFRKLLNDRLSEVRQNPLPYQFQEFEEAWKKLRRSNSDDFKKSPETSISLEVIEKVGKALTSLPEGFKPLKQIEKLIKDRKQMFFETKELNWAAAELLAYGSLLVDGFPVRISGQDVQRGTFSHRHSVLSDKDTNERYFSLNYIEEGQQPLDIYNSLLSEYGVLGFEFGYSMATPNTLVIWEAQFGDFANGAQIAIDQFITSAESKWNRMHGLVMLLPHGYEGQGPEHSNARPERFLQLAAEDNIVVTNITTPANFFHAMRRQVSWEFRKPMVVMSPKSMLRHPKVVSTFDEFTSGSFQEVIGDSYVDNKKVEKVLLCTGKVYYDLLEKQQEEKIKDVAIVRLEQLHPFPEDMVEAEFQKYPNLKKIVWVQEEPVNMGYWTYILRTYHSRKNIELVARKPSASPATGFAKIHAREQEKIVAAAFNR